MAGYWNNGLTRFNGDIYNIGLYTLFAPFYSFYLAELFKVLTFLNLFNNKLEIALLLQIVFGTVSVFFLYLASTHIIKSKKLCLYVTFFYAFAYPIIYLNALIMAENLSIPMTIISLGLILTFHKDSYIMFLAGLILAAGVAARPSTGLVLFPYVLYIAFAEQFSKKSLRNAVIFSLGFVLVTGLVVMEISKNSRGEVKSLSGNAGSQFFIGQCKAQLVHCNPPGYHFEVGDPGLLGHPEWARMNFETTHPFHDQKYFFERGLQCIRLNPNIWLDDFICLKGIFSKTLFPSMLSARWFEPLIKISNFIILFMTLSIGFLYFLIRDKRVEIKKVLLIASIPLLIILTNYIFAEEQRYYFPAYFALYLIFFTILDNIKYYFREAMIYSVLALIAMSYIL